MPIPVVTVKGLRYKQELKNYASATTHINIICSFNHILFTALSVHKLQRQGNFERLIAKDLGVQLVVPSENVVWETEQKQEH
jgi:hypothetical protein